MKLWALAFLIILSFFLLVMTPIASASGVSAEYAFCKTCQIQGSPDGALSDYQIKFIVHRRDGTDSGQDVYLKGDAQSWPYDIRFEDDNGVLFPYWIESSDASTAIFWVKIGNIPAAPASGTVKLYYGKPDDMGMSDGAATFPFFDHFSGSSMDTSKWKQLSGDPGATRVANSVAAISDPGDTWDQWVSFSTFNKPYAIEALVRVSADNDAWIVGNSISTGGPDMFIGTFWSRNQYESGKSIIDRKTDLTTWTRVSMLAGNAGSTFEENGSVRARISKPTPDGQYLELAAIHHKTLFADWILVRKYTPNEPVLSAGNAASKANTQVSQPSPSGTGIIGYISSNFVLISLIILALVAIFMIGVLVLAIALTVFKY